MLKTFHSIRFDQKRANFGHTTMALKRSIAIVVRNGLFGEGCDVISGAGAVER